MNKSPVSSSGRKILITDFDGTLVDDDKKVSRQNLETLIRLRRNGELTALATGRSLYSLEKALADMGRPRQEYDWPFDYIILSTGAGILDGRTWEILQRQSLTRADIDRITDYFDTRQMDHMVLEAIPWTHWFEYRSYGGDNPDFHQRMALYQDYARPMGKDGRPIDEATEVMTIVPCRSSADGLSVSKEIQQALSGFSVIPATSPLDHTSLWIEVFQKGVCKSSAADWLCRHLEIDPGDVVAVGNDYNDEDLLEWAGDAYVVANAPEALISRFTTVSSNNHSGVAEAARVSGLL